jgi:hypothetical protein
MQIDTSSSPPWATIGGIFFALAWEIPTAFKRSVQGVQDAQTRLKLWKVNRLNVLLLKRIDFF